MCHANVACNVALLGGLNHWSSKWKTRSNLALSLGQFPPTGGHGTRDLMLLLVAENALLPHNVACHQVLIICLILLALHEQIISLPPMQHSSLKLNEQLETI